MELEKAILSALEEVTGVDYDELAEDLDMDLFEAQLMDSLGIVTLLNEIGEKVGVRFDVMKFVPKDFRTVHTMEEAIKLQMNG